MVGVTPLTAYDLPALRQRRSMKWRRYPDDVLPLWVAEMDTPIAPPIAAAMRAAIDRGDTGYADPGQLAEAFVGFAQHRWGWWPDPAEIRLVGDVADGIREALRLVTRPGDEVLINTPAYPPFLRLIPHADRGVRTSPLAREPGGRYRLDLDRLARDLAAPEVTAYLLVNPHNPTGLVLSRDELSAVAGLCDEQGVRVLADEIHAPLIFPEAKFVPILTLAEAQRALAFHAASKAWNLAGLKAAVVVPGVGAVDDLRSMSRDVEVAAGLLGVLASDAAFRHGGPWLDELLAGLDENRALLGSLLAAELPEVGYLPPEATYLAWLDCTGLRLGPDPAEIFLEYGRVALSPGPTFGDPGDGFARLNFGTSPDLLAEGVRRMAGAVSRFRESRPSDR
jgi:cystathionine beta-lyase